MNIKLFLFKSAIIMAIFGQHTKPARSHKDIASVKAYRQSGRDGFAYIASLSRMQRRKLAIGR